MKATWLIKRFSHTIFITINNNSNNNHNDFCLFNYV
jgi:hypothetical protein